MKKALVTICVGERYEKLAEVTHPTLKAYADKIGAEFIVWRNSLGHVHPGYKKLEIAKLLEEFDRVLYVDTDILIREDAEDIFSVVPEDTFGAFNEFCFTPRVEAMSSFANDQAWIKKEKYFNTGVFVCSKCHKDIFRPAVPEILNFYEQTYLNYMIHVTGAKTGEIHHKFNRMSCMDKLTGESRYDSYFMHYAGVPLETEPFVLLLKADLGVWEKAKPEYRFPKNIYLNAQGGLGDLIASEPAVRHIREQFYKEANFVLQTHHPEVYDHLEGVTFHTPGVHLPDVGFKEFDLMPQGAKIINQFVVHALCHPTDYASLMLFKGQLSNVKKRIHLSTEGHTLSEKNLVNLSGSVLIHAGKGWKSKTFPSKFWQAVVDGIIAAGIDVSLIGKTTGEDQGFVEVFCSHKGESTTHDFRDKLSLKDLFKAVETAPVLISNDSSPIHIAGAFDNWIGLIASCKDAFRIMPYRNGLQGWKATNLSNGIIDRTYDPTYPYFVGIHDATEEDLKKVLPEPENVVNWAVSRFKESKK